MTKAKLWLLTLMIPWPSLSEISAVSAIFFTDTVAIVWATCALLPYQQSSHLTLAMGTMRYGTWISNRLWDNFWKASYRVGLRAVLIAGVLLVRRTAPCGIDYLGPSWTLSKVTQLPSWGPHLQENISWFNNEPTTVSISFKRSK